MGFLATILIVILILKFPFIFLGIILFGFISDLILNFRKNWLAVIVDSIIIVFVIDIIIYLLR